MTLLSRLNSFMCIVLTFISSPAFARYGEFRAKSSSVPNDPEALTFIIGSFLAFISALVVTVVISGLIQRGVRREVFGCFLGGMMFSVLPAALVTLSSDGRVDFLIIFFSLSYFIGLCMTINYIVDVRNKANI